MATSLPKGSVAQCPQPVKADIKLVSGDSGFDPSPTLAVHCGNGLIPISAPIKVLV
jgi:hypothetical protein